MHRLHTVLYWAGLSYIPIRGTDFFPSHSKEKQTVKKAVFLQKVSSLLLSRKAGRRVHLLLAAVAAPQHQKDKV